ncbi:MAG: hypothetical protein ACJAUP_002162 [Cellvibrionaceae bacterium]|jgi:hypothetical protein
MLAKSGAAELAKKRLKQSSRNPPLPALLGCF